MHISGQNLRQKNSCLKPYKPENRHFPALNAVYSVLMNPRQNPTVEYNQINLFAYSYKIGNQNYNYAYNALRNIKSIKITNKDWFEIVYVIQIY